MQPWFEVVTDLFAQADVLRRRRYGVIDVVDGQFVGVRLRPYPKLVWIPELLLVGRHYHNRCRGNRCRLYYNQPRRFPNFLTVQYIVSTRDCTLQTARRAMLILDEIARIKFSDALIADAWNWRIPDRLCRRWGWEAHAPSRWHRHYIKRFYGSYPQSSEAGGIPADEAALSAAQSEH